MRFSKNKLLYDLISQLFTSAIILLTLNYIFSPELFNQRIDFVVLSTLLFAALMLLIYVFFIFAGPTIISIKFGTDHLIFEFVKGYGERTVFYKDIKWIKKTGIMKNNYDICINGENIPLFLTLFKKNDRFNIVETIEKYTDRT